jgi:hypothetical protein
MSGTFGYEATPENNQNTALCKTVQGGLRILNMNGLGLAGLALPDCLMGPKSTLEELRLGAAPSQLSAAVAVQSRMQTTATGCAQLLALCSSVVVCSHAVQQLIACCTWGLMPCVRSTSMLVSAAAAAGNGLVGTLPDVYNDNSPLQYLSLRNNKMTGTIPATLGKAGDLQVLQSRV